MSNKGQHGLFDRPLPAGEGLAARWEEFHRDNPHVLKAIISIALELKGSRGFRCCGVKLIMERLRWLPAIKAKGDDGFKLNNSYSAFYAREAMRVEPRLAGFFRLREQRHQDR